MSFNSRTWIAMMLILSFLLAGCDRECRIELNRCLESEDQVAIDLSQCQTALGQCQATGPSVCSVAGLLHYLDNYKAERLAAGDTLTLEECNLVGSELEILQGLETSDGTQTSHFLELRDHDGDGIGDGLMLMTNPLSGNVQSGQVTLALDGVPASLAVRQSCFDLATALDLCGN